MAGHNKWSKIKRKKGVADQRRGQLWSKLARNIIVAAKHGGGDPAANLTLRYAIEKAKQALMPADTIDKAIAKGTGGAGGADYIPAVYEGYGPGGVAIIVDALTDNPARTAPEIKKIFERGGGNLGATNCVSWNFSTKGVFTIAATATSEEALMEVALDAGAEDVKQEEDGFLVTCEVAAFHGLRKALEEKGISIQNAEITKLPGSTIQLADSEMGGRLMRLIETFEEHDDVQNVYTNFDMPEELLAKLA